MTNTGQLLKWTPTAACQSAHVLKSTGKSVGLLAIYTVYLCTWSVKVGGHTWLDGDGLTFQNALHMPQFRLNYAWVWNNRHYSIGERGGSVVECWTPEREVGGSKPTAAVLCPWARYFTPRKYWLITQEAVAPSRHDWKIVDWDVKPQLKQTNKLFYLGSEQQRCWSDCTNAQADLQLCCSHMV